MGDSLGPAGVVGIIICALVLLLHYILSSPCRYGVAQVCACVCCILILFLYDLRACACGTTSVVAVVHSSPVAHLQPRRG